VAEVQETKVSPPALRGVYAQPGISRSFCLSARAARSKRRHEGRGAKVGSHIEARGLV
jgi:hypothetical protein